jgi:alpha-N-arabinofuranosidase
MTTERGFVKQTTYWPLLLFSRYMRRKSLATHVRSLAYKGKTCSAWLESTVDLPLLDVSTALSDDVWMTLAVVDISETEDMSPTLPVQTIEGSVRVFAIGGSENHVRDNNQEGAEKVAIRESIWKGKERFIFEKHSFMLMGWRVKV